MGDYKLLYRRKYRGVSLDPATIDEYMIFNDSTGNTRFMVSKIRNRTAYNILNFVIEVIQLNLQNEIISKASYRYDGLNIDEYKSVVPNEKIELDLTCTSIEAHLISAETEDKIWEKGIWSNKETEKIDTTEKVEEIETPKNVLFNRKVIEKERYKFPVHLTFGVAAIFAVTIIAIYYIIN